MLFVAILHYKQLNHTDVKPKGLDNEQMNNTCKKLRLFNETRFMSSEINVISDEYRYAFCLMPKVASSSWVFILHKLSGKTFYGKDYRAYHYLRGIRIITSEIRMLMKKYYKIMFVREPLERLVSAYRDKIVHNSRIPDIKGIIKGLMKRRTLSKSTQKGKLQNLPSETYRTPTPMWDIVRTTAR